MLFLFCSETTSSFYLDSVVINSGGASKDNNDSCLNRYRLTGEISFLSYVPNMDLLLYYRILFHG